jgi:hypothetical protein
VAQPEGHSPNCHESTVRVFRDLSEHSRQVAVGGHPSLYGGALALGVTMLDMGDDRPRNRRARLQRGVEDRVNPQPTPRSQDDGALAAEEFQSLRAEIIARIQKQQDIMNFAILVMTALLTYAGFEKSNSVSLGHTVEILGAPASLALSIFALMTLDHEMNIAHATKYIDGHLRKTWRNATNSSVNVLLWNSFRSRWQQHPGWPDIVLPTTVAAAKYYAITCLNLSLVVTAWIEFASRMGQYNDLSLALISLATALLILTLVASVYTSRLWLGMEPISKEFLNSDGDSGRDVLERNRPDGKEQGEG